MPIAFSSYDQQSAPQTITIGSDDYTLIWNDEFNGVSGSAPGSDWFFFDAWGAGTWRDAVYDSGHAKLDGDGHLVISGEFYNGNFVTSFLKTFVESDPGTAKRWTPNDGDLCIEYSVRVSDFVRSGPWCAAWTHESFGGDDEIDDLEYFNYLGLENSFNTATHGAAGGSDVPGSFHDASSYGVNLQDGQFHKVRRIWRQNGTLDFYLDDTLVRTITDPTKVPMNQQGIHLSIEYDEPPSVWGFGEDINDRPGLCKFEVDYVRIYRKTTSATPVIIDTDLSGDVDDVGAFAIAAKLHNASECNILCAGSCVWNSYSVSAISAIFDFYGLGSIPIARQAAGVNSIGTETDGYAKHLHDNFAPSQTSASAPSSTDLYRQHLAAQADGSVVFITTGTLNNIKALLDSAADGYSTLTGEALFNAKVQRMHVMGGQYPTSTGGGNGEWNFAGSGTGVAADVFSRITVPTYFNGFEVGNLGGGWGAAAALDAENRTTNPVAAAYGYWFEFPHSWVNGGVSQSNIDDWSTWDPIAVFTAIRGTSGYFTLVDTGYNDIATDGHNTWAASPDGNQAYLVESMAPATFAKTHLEPLMLP